MGMPKGACIINAARKVIDEGLAKAFEERQDLKYATDIAPDNYELLKENWQSRFAPQKWALKPQRPISMQAWPL